MFHSICRVLVVEDFEPFLRVLISALAEVSGLEIVGEVSDGLEAVRQAERLQPDLILVDIGLPTLNGIEAARRIHKLVPACKILFLSQECFADVVQEAFNSGALGYVVKAHARKRTTGCCGGGPSGQAFCQQWIISSSTSTDASPPTTKSSLIKLF